MQTELLKLFSARTGHFKLESGHHGDFWLDLDPLFLRPRALQASVRQLAQQIVAHRPQAVCGPFSGGAWIAQSIALELDLEFFYTERIVAESGSVTYRLPDSLKPFAAGKRFAIVDDVINAASAVKGTCAAIRAAGGLPIVIGALLILGSSAPDHFASEHIPLQSLARQDNRLWSPEDCPLCAENVPLESV